MEFTALFALVGLVVQAIQAIWIARIQAESKRVADDNQRLAVVNQDIHEKISELAHQTNAMKDALVEVTAKSSHAEGVLEEKTRQETGAP